MDAQKYDEQFQRNCEDLLATNRRKRHDYASDDDPLSNFRFVAYVVDFAVKKGVRGRALVYLVHIATKLARLIELLGAGKVPNNESIEDTLRDLGVYSQIWRTDLQMQKKEEE